MAAIRSICSLVGFLAVTLALRATAKQSADSPTAIRKTDSKSVLFVSNRPLTPFPEILFYRPGI
jgi:hypothetical protein